MANNSGEFLIAVDLEGVHGVVGEPFKGLTVSFDYPIAVANAQKEVDVIVRALFDNGAKKVVVWDNHGNGKNMDFSQMDSRIIRADVSSDVYRMDFCQNYNFQKIFFVGYHSMEGTFNGVLAHTFSSVDVQYIKVNGVEVGEYEIDCWIAATHNVAPAFASSDDIALRQISAIDKNIVTVCTKIAQGRNDVIFYDEEIVLEEMYRGAVTAMNVETNAQHISLPITMEVRFTRTEYASKVFQKVASREDVQVHYGNDAHILIFQTENVRILPDMLWC